jgi:hypothetical protein
VLYLANCGFCGILLITSRKCSYTKLLIGKNQGVFTNFWEAGGETEGANWNENLWTSSPVSLVLAYGKDLWRDMQNVSQNLPGRRYRYKKIELPRPPPSPTHYGKQARLSDKSNQPAALRRELGWSKRDRSGVNNQNFLQDRPGCANVTDFPIGEHYDRQTSRYHRSDRRK